MMDDIDDEEVSSHTTGHLSGHMTSRVEIGHLEEPTDFGLMAT